MPGATLESLKETRRMAERVCRAFTDKGRSVRWLRSTFTPGDSRCRCLFEADSADLVQEVNDAAQLPYSRIIIAIDIGEHS
jgi:hypothetical protein